MKIIKSVLFSGPSQCAPRRALWDVRPWDSTCSENEKALGNSGQTRQTRDVMQEGCHTLPRLLPDSSIACHTYFPGAFERKPLSSWRSSQDRKGTEKLS